MFSLIKGELTYLTKCIAKQNFEVNVGGHLNDWDGVLFEFITRFIHSYKH